MINCHRCGTPVDEKTVVSCPNCAQKLYAPLRPWIADSVRPKCALCQKPFYVITRRRHHCRECGEVVCDACSPYLREIFRGLFRICKSCHAGGGTPMQDIIAAELQQGGKAPAEQIPWWEERPFKGKDVDAMFHESDDLYKKIMGAIERESFQSNPQQFFTDCYLYFFTVNEELTRAKIDTEDTRLVASVTFEHCTSYLTPYPQLKYHQSKSLRLELVRKLRLISLFAIDIPTNYYAELQAFIRGHAISFQRGSPVQMQGMPPVQGHGGPAVQRGVSPIENLTHEILLVIAKIFQVIQYTLGYFENKYPEEYTETQVTEAAIKEYHDKAFRRLISFVDQKLFETKKK